LRENLPPPQNKTDRRTAFAVKTVLASVLLKFAQKLR